MTNAQRLQQSAALLDSRAGFKPQSPEYQVQCLHQEVLEDLVARGATKLNLPIQAPKAAKKPSRKSSAAPAAAASPEAERAAE